ncbi:hypothetical protein GCM10022223_14000 [Kineosporia mesophila]|uniref:RNA polymerase sigma-70 region 2 domain-containing protein n=1 Tax=Kineosporia mesophila TaxID=566012 RepID=A0ABP6Z7S3_9ACTN
MRNDEAELAAFYESTRPACQRAVRATVGNAAPAEELVAEAFARAWAKVRRHPAPEAWVVRTCLNAHVSW